MKIHLFKVVLLLQTMLLFTSCKTERASYPANSNTFVFVHGSWQGPWVWDKVKDQLIKEGQKVIVIELPAHGDDTTHAAAASIDSYQDKVITAINKVQGKVILVGHSMGGIIISGVAEKIPGKIEKLIYIGAFLPANGQSLLDLANMDKQSLLGPALIPSADQLTLDVAHEAIVAIFCGDAPESVQQEMMEKYRPEPAIPFTNKIALTEINFGSIKKYYVHTLKDNAIGLDLQKEMVAAAKITMTFSLNTSHSPFLSKPDELVKILVTIATL